MEEAKALAQQQLMQQQQQQRQQLLLLQQIQQQKHQQQAISRFPSNIDAHLLPSVLHRPINHEQSQPQPPSLQQHQQSPNPNPISNPPNSNHLIPNQQNPNSNPLHQQQQKANRPPANQAELQMAYQDAWRVCNPDFKLPFSSLENACERGLFGKRLNYSSDCLAG